jgi:hypothetical protein
MRARPSLAPIGVRVALAGSALLLGACGGASATPHFTTVADAICANANTLIERLPPVGSTLGTEAASANAELPIVSVEFAQLGRLHAPSSAAAEFAQALSAGKREIALLPKLILAVRAFDTQQVGKLAAHGETLVAEETSAMSSIGLVECAREVQPRGST